MQIWISIVVNADGQIDAELLDSEPTESFREGLDSFYENGDIVHWEIRLGSVNGGDSSVEYGTSGRISGF